jgi:hypothetical protein
MTLSRAYLQGGDVQPVVMLLSLAGFARPRSLARFATVVEVLGCARGGACPAVQHRASRGGAALKPRVKIPTRASERKRWFACIWNILHNVRPK